MEEDRIESGPGAEIKQQPASEGGERPEDTERVIEPDNALPEITLEDLPEPIRAACSRAG